MDLELTDLATLSCRCSPVSVPICPLGLGGKWKSRHKPLHLYFFTQVLAIKYQNSGHLKQHVFDP